MLNKNDEELVRDIEKMLTKMSDVFVITYSSSDAKEIRDAKPNNVELTILFKDKNYKLTVGISDSTFNFAYFVKIEDVQNWLTFYGEDEISIKNAIKAAVESFVSSKEKTFVN